MVASAYIDPVVDPSGPLTTADIETPSCKPAGRLGRDRVRKGLYAKCFPHPFERGLWSAKAVAEWLASAGGAEHRSRTSQRVRQISPIRSPDRSQHSGPKVLASLKQTNLSSWRPSVDETDNYVSAGIL